LFPWSTTRSGTLGDSLMVCVLCSMHTALWAGCVCVYTICFALGLWEDQLGRVDHICSILISLLTCQVALPLGITLVFGLCVCDCREQCDALDEDQDPLEQDLHDDHLV
jgi:hypothetical protein